MLRTASAWLELLEKQLRNAPWPSGGSVALSVHEGRGPQPGRLVEPKLADASVALADIAKSTDASATLLLFSCTLDHVPMPS
jgi:hypothetical protein